METKTKYSTVKPYTSTRNACKLCTPLGACVAFKGIRGCVPLIHGSQGCATYIRRYMISHYREPVDIASSSFSEEAAVFGGNQLFNTGITNIINQYHPEIIAITSTCLSETIGEDVPKLIKEFESLHKNKNIPAFVSASTPSYQGTHLDGFHEAVISLVKKFAKEGSCNDKVNLFSGFISPEDIRHLKDIMTDFGLPFNLVPDYSESLDNPNWQEYTRIPEGGTTLEELASTGSAKASIELGSVFNRASSTAKNNGHGKLITAGEFLESKFGVVNFQTSLPIGIKGTDRFFKILNELSGKETPRRHQLNRGRLVDAYIDAHKYVFGKKAVLYGDEDLVIGLFSFLEEIGIETVLIVSGGESGLLKEKLQSVTNRPLANHLVMPGSDFETIRELSLDLKPDLFMGNSKSYYITRELGIPLIRVGFPVHDRFGAQRIQHIGYRGTQQLFDRIVNALLEYKQEHAEVAYKYI